MKSKHPKLQKCEECGKEIERGTDCFGRETEGWAIIHKKQVCQMCFVRLKINSKTRARPTATNLWKRWMELSEK